jgi:hypothetical protein
MVAISTSLDGDWPVPGQEGEQFRHTAKAADASKGQPGADERCQPEEIG